jgi:hypothetical protein
MSSIGGYLLDYVALFNIRIAKRYLLTEQIVLLVPKIKPTLIECTLLRYW